MTHDTIVSTFAATLEPLPFLDAMWEGGAAAFHRLDEWSDVDLDIVATDDRVPETFHAIEVALTRLSRSTEDLPELGRQALEWFREVLPTVTEAAIRTKLGTLM
ncbi:MAG TPA: hypothetical protein VEY12_04730 [Thermoplasmata archaeon]|nr:hypothetical protein [Thermoplasmata archaeon]